MKHLVGMKESKILLIGAILFLFVGSSFSQNDTLYGFYYANGSRHYWTEDHTSLNIIVKNLNHYDSIAARLGRIFNGAQDEIWADDEDNNIIVNSGSLASRSVSEIVSLISLSGDDIAFTTYAKQINGNPIWLTNEAYVKLKNNSYYASHIQPTLLQYPNVVSYYEGDNEYRFVCPTDSMVVTLANKLYDTACVVYSSPDFYSLGCLHTNDTYYDDQWNLKNAGQQGGTPGVDIKAEEAWAFVEKVIGAPGSNIKVAVIDDGVEEHEDFYESGGVSVILDGYTANGYGNGRPRPLNQHGECCAGIIAAVHNNLGIAGVAPHSRIVPIRVYKNSWPGILFSQRKVAKAITKSWEVYDANVLSCSWGNISCDYIDNAIIEASNEGRDGKGCIIVFSSGNESNDSVSRPSDLEHVLCVGSIDKYGQRSGFSNYGPEIDLTAPGEGIITTDRMGDYGQCGNQTLDPNYFKSFIGTSAACPHVSGVAALMLSVNPNLTREQVYTILEGTAQKLSNYNYTNNNNHPNGTWNQETGYGLVDAHMAVVKSFLSGYNLSVNGPNSFSWDPCEEYEYSLSIPHPEYFTYNWSCSSNLIISSSNLNTISVVPTGNGASYVRVEVYSEGRFIGVYSKDFTVSTNYYLMGATPISITSNTNWTSNNHVVLSEVIVEPGATLTITGTVHCSDHGCFKVKPQGRLIIDGGRLTNLCSDEMWPGIEVWGDYFTHQFQINGCYGQGYLELKNGAVIENAVSAVELWNPGHYSTTGGIIHASDATFLNNARAVRAICYTNYSPYNDRETDYNAAFNNCSFVIDGNYPGTETFNAHVNLAEVKGIDFKGCDFSVDRRVDGVYQWCMGISAYDAGFSVNSRCISSHVSPCPEQDIDSSSFTGFCSGIRATSDGNSPRSFLVKETVFDQNDTGIYAENTGYPTVHFNSFDIGGRDYCQFNYGIKLIGVTSFCVEENVFNVSSNPTSTTLGVAVYDSQGVNDVYRNHFSNLSCGNLARGQNVTAPNGVTDPPGLTYSCNTNSGNSNDFGVFQNDGIGDIQSSQGSTAKPAGNTFSASSYHFYNEGSQTVNYYYYNGNSAEIPNISKLVHVNAIGTNNANLCRSNSGRVIMTPSEKTALESEYLSAYTAYLNLRQMYENRIDGGNTATQVTDIENATAADMWQLRARLLGLSPYVSAKVLTAAADRNDIFSDPVLFEILAANPDELRKDSLINYLEHKEHPVPEYMVGLLRQLASGVTARTALVAEMGMYGHDYSLAAGNIVRSNLNDSIANPTELRNWLGNLNDIAADRMAVSSYIQEGDSASAFALANLLPELYNLQGDGLADHDDYMRLIRLYQSLKSSHRNVYQLTQTETETVNDIADNGVGVSKSMARCLVEQATGVIRCACLDPEIPDGQEGGRGITPTGHSLNEAMGFTVDVTPNPATTWAVLDYTLPADGTRAVINVTNTLGVLVMSIELNGHQGQKLLDFRNLAGGVYTYTVSCGALMETGKLVIAK